MGKSYCPVCGSEDVEDRGDGKQYCLDCGNVGTLFPQKKLLIEDIDDEDLAEEQASPPKKGKKLKVKKEAKKTIKSKIKKGKKK